jgi:hypothetical protein
MLAVVVLLLCALPLAAQDSAAPEPTVRQAVGFAVSPPLRDLAKLPRAPQYGLHEALPVRRIPKRNFGVAVDPVEQNTARPSTNYSIGMNFLGVGNGFLGFSVTDPAPDTNMAVGDTQIVQWVNGSFAVFNKFSGATLAGPILGNDLFSALGGPCATYNDGGIAAQWDNAAHQWLLAQNVLHGPTYYACVAVSMTADATGPYYLYPFSLGNGFPDYPKWGRWNTSWSQTMNNFGPGGSGFVGAEVCLYNRTALLNGQSGPPAIQVCHQFSANDDSLLPADIDSSTNPPAAECQFFIGSVDAVNNSHLSLYSACINWLHPSQATFTGNNNSQLIAVPTYTGSCGGAFGIIACVPQKGVSDMLDSLGDRLMYRFAYDNDPVGGKQHWYVNHDVEASSGQIGVRWYEFQAPQIAIAPLALTLFQSGTYAPPDSNYRWMGSIAGDINNDILLGYSESSSSMYPSIAVAGRLKTDTLGTLEPEVSVVAGTGSQTDTNNRWGDYSAMRIDPDGCTFWYTTEYYMLTASFDWSTQIASARFGSCQNPAYDGYIELCKQADPDYPPLPVLFSFTLTAGPFFSKGPIVVPVGSCSPPIQVPSGVIIITEAPQVGVAVENVTAYSYDQFGNYIDELDSWTPPEQTATVTVMPGGVNLETVATFTNYAAPPGTLKICKIAGTPSLVGTPFTFTASDGTNQHRDIVNAGPAPGGNCVIDGTWPVNDPVTVTETIPPGVSVSSITVEPPDRGGPPNLSGGYVTVTIGSGFTEVDFTDVVATVPPGSCLPSESLSTQGNGTNVVAYVPLGNWGPFGLPGVAVANIEGNYINNSPALAMTPNPGNTDRINSCASDPTLNPPVTVCTAQFDSSGVNTTAVYTITGNNPFTVTQLQSGGSGTIEFSAGGQSECLNCGIAMDSVHHQAVIGLSDAKKPAFQFLFLTTPNPASCTPAPCFAPGLSDSPAHQISEDFLIDPIFNPPLLLSPAEGAFCYPPPLPPAKCQPNYEIADITNPQSPVFYENPIGNESDFPGGVPDSAGADCGAQIALSSIESITNPTQLYVADFTHLTPLTNPWSAPDQFVSLLESKLVSGGATPGPIAVAQGGSHLGVLGQETGGAQSQIANTITAFQLNVPPYSTSNPPVADWVICKLGTDPATGVLFKQGFDPHTVTAYQSPGANQFPMGDAIAVLANQTFQTIKPNYAPDTVAVVDLSEMINIQYVPRNQFFPHVCGNSPTGDPGNLPQIPAVVSFVKVR